MAHIEESSTFADFYHPGLKRDARTGKGKPCPFPPANLSAQQILAAYKKQIVHLSLLPARFFLPVALKLIFAENFHRFALAMCHLKFLLALHPQRLPFGKDL